MKFKVKNYCIFFILIMLFLVVLVGCSEHKEFENNVSHNAKSLAEQYNIESSSIKIYRLGFQEPIVISDEQDVQKLINDVDFDNWKYIDHEQYEGVESIFVKFNDSTTIAMYDDVPYGLIGQGSPDELGNLQNCDAYYTFPQEFLDTVLQMIEKYSK